MFPQRFGNVRGVLPNRGRFSGVGPSSKLLQEWSRQLSSRPLLGWQVVSQGVLPVGWTLRQNCKSGVASSGRAFVNCITYSTLLVVHR